MEDFWLLNPSMILKIGIGIFSMIQGCFSKWENRKAAPAHEAEGEKMNMNKTAAAVRGGVKVFRGKYVRELISGRKGMIETGTKVCIGAGRFLMIAFRPSMKRYDLLEVR
jgi:hypothetical protein